MKHNIFTSTKNWSFTQSDEQAELKFKQLENEVRSSLPESFYHLRTITHLAHLQQTPLYQLMHSIPKGVMHHNHYFCNDDQEFYRKYIIDDPRIYLTRELDKIEIGNSQTAKQNCWISMAQGKILFGAEEWLQMVVGLTTFTKRELQILSYRSRQMWDVFETKIRCPLRIYFVRDIFQKYTRHVMLKYIRNGYDRLEIRSTYERLAEYDEQGNYVMHHEHCVFANLFESILEQIAKTHPNFSFGLIYVGFKMLSDEQNFQLFKKACEVNWKRMEGFDFVQEEDKYDSLERYDRIIERIYEEFPHLSHLKKVYHAGETANHRTENIDIAVKAGSVRIGHGLNILQRVEFLPHCKHVCFEKNPVSNLLLGYKDDTREASAPILLGLGIPVSISPDDPGKFGLEDSTVDYIVSALSYNWTLRHLKLIAIHSINHSLCDESAKDRLVHSFNQSWNAWVSAYLGKEGAVNESHQYHYDDVFAYSRNWSFNAEEERQNERYIRARDALLNQIPENVYQSKSFVISGTFRQHDELAKSSKIAQLLKTMPKGALLSCHLTANHDQAFFIKHVLSAKNLYLSEQEKMLRFGTEAEAEQHSWISMEKLELKYEDSEALAEYLYGLCSIGRLELETISGKVEEFWKLHNKKKENFSHLLRNKTVFANYVAHVFRKLASFGYERVEFRFEPFALAEYSQNGEIVREYDFSELATIIDQQFVAVQKQHPSFTVGFIILGNKEYSPEKNYEMLNKFCQLSWAKHVGFDFEQGAEYSYPSLNSYNAVIDNLLQKYDGRNYQKVYQGGNTSDHLNKNIEIALQSGAKRILNGVNILQQIDLLPQCKETCFEVNPILNLVEGGSKRSDFRLGIAPILLGLGFPVSIGSDFSGLLGFETPLFDLFACAIAFNWSLKHFKLTQLHSINHSLATEGLKKRMLSDFNRRWAEWISKLQLE